jgi:hypothetical protein
VHRRPCSARAAISRPMPGARPHSSGPSPKTARPTWKIRRRPCPVGGRPGQQQEAGQHQSVRADRPLQARHEPCRSRQRDVDDRNVHHHDHAGAADRQHQQPAAPAELGRPRPAGPRWPRNRASATGTPTARRATAQLALGDMKSAPKAACRLGCCGQEGGQRSVQASARAARLAARCKLRYRPGNGPYLGGLSSSRRQ